MAYPDNPAVFKSDNFKIEGWYFTYILFILFFASDFFIFILDTSSVEKVTATPKPETNSLTVEHIIIIVCACVAVVSVLAAVVGLQIYRKRQSKTYFVKTDSIRMNRLEYF